jgi:hypothetical protein
MGELPTEEIWKVVRPRLRRYVLEVDNAGCIRDFTNSDNIRTVGMWLTGTLPFATALIKLWHLLADLGYESPELDALSPVNRYLGRLFAYDVLDMDALRGVDVLSVKLPQNVLRILRGQNLAAPLTLGALEERYQAKLDARVAEKMAKVPRPRTASQPHEQTHAPIASSTTGGRDRSDLVAVLDPPDVPPTTTPAPSAGISEALVAGASDPVLLLATLLGPAAPLARVLVLESSPEVRSRFRTLMGMPGIAALPDLVNLLDALRTERAYDEFMRSIS